MTEGERRGGREGGKERGREGGREGEWEGGGGREGEWEGGGGRGREMEWGVECVCALVFVPLSALQGIPPLPVPSLKENTYPLSCDKHHHISTHTCMSTVNHPVLRTVVIHPASKVCCVLSTWD